jgi:hypothetical protein
MSGPDTSLTTAERAIAELGEKVFGIAEPDQIARSCPVLAGLMARRRAERAKLAAGRARPAPRSDYRAVTNRILDERPA